MDFIAKKFVFALLRSLLIMMCMVLMIPFAVGQKKKKSNPISEKISQDVAMKAESSFIEAEKQYILENYTKAYDLFLLADELNPDNAAINFKISQVLDKNGNKEESLEYIQKAIDIDTENKYYYLFKAEILKSNQQLQKAAGVYELLIRKFPGNEYYYYDLAAIYQTQNKLDKALEYYDLIEEEFGLSEPVMYEKQKIYLRRNNMMQLISDWDEFTLQNPGEPRYVLELCNILILNDLEDKAVPRLEQFNLDFPGNSNSYLLLSEISRKKGDFEKSLELLETPFSSLDVEVMPKVQLLNNYIGIASQYEIVDKVLALLEILITTHINSYDAIAFAGDAYFQFEDMVRAQKMYVDAVNINPSVFGAWQNIIRIDVDNEEYDSLIAHTEQALEYFPNQSMLYYYNGFGNYMVKSYQRAVQTLEQGKKYTSDPDLLTVFYGQLGDVYNSLSNHQKSDEAYESALKHDPANDHVLNNYSYFLSLRGEKLDRALEMSRNLVDRNPDDGTFLDTYGWVLFVMGDYQLAEKILKRAMDMKEDGTILEHYGDVLFKLGQEQEAVEFWERAKELGGTTEQIDRKISERMIYE